MENIKEQECTEMVQAPEKMQEKTNKELETTVEYATINFAFPMSRHEADEILKHPKGKTMKNFMEYMKKVVVSAAKKYSEVPTGETVTDCKVPIE